MTNEEKNLTYEQWKDSLNMSWDEFYKYSNTIQSFFDFAEYLKTTSPTKCFIPFVGQSFYCLEVITTPDDGKCKKQCEFCKKEETKQ